MDEINDKINTKPELLDPVEAEDFAVPETAVTLSPSVMIHLHKLILFLGLLIVSVIGLSRVTENTRIYDLLGKPDVSAKSSKIWLKFLNIHVSEDLINYPLYLIAIVSIIMLIHYVLDAKMTKFSVNFNFIEIKKGILNQSVDTIEMVKVRDQTLEKPIHLRVLGLCKLIVLSKDDTHPTLNMTAVNTKHAELFMNFIRRNSYGSATEFWVAKDRRRRAENKKTHQDPNKGAGKDPIVPFDE